MNATEVQLLSALVQAASSVVLVAVTTWYAALTNKISRANSLAAAEMREQRFAAAQPLVVPRIAGFIKFKRIPEVIDVELSNFGNGPALKLSFGLQLGGVHFKTDPQTTLPTSVLRSNGSELAIQFRSRRSAIEPLQDAQESLVGLLEVSYGDVYGRTFRVLTQFSFEPIDGQVGAIEFSSSVIH
jgi:hypothetical protein